MILLFLGPLLVLLVLVVFLIRTVKLANQNRTNMVLKNSSSKRCHKDAGSFDYNIHNLSDMEESGEL